MNRLWALLLTGCCFSIFSQNIKANPSGEVELSCPGLLVATNLFWRLCSRVSTYLARAAIAKEATASSHVEDKLCTKSKLQEETFYGY